MINHFCCVHIAWSFTGASGRFWIHDTDVREAGWAAVRVAGSLDALLCKSNIKLLFYCGNEMMTWFEK